MAADMAATADMKSAIAREGRPSGGNYCVLSINDNGTAGIKVSSYDSEALTEVDMKVPYSKVSELLNQAVDEKTPLETKAPLYTLFLKDFVVLEGAGAKQKLSLVEGSGTAEDLLFDATGGLDSTLGGSSVLAPSSPAAGAGRPGTTPGGARGGARGGAGGAGEGRPSTTASGSRSRKKPKMMATSKSAGSVGPGSPGKKTSSKRIAGYVPPTDMSGIDDKILENARGLIASDSAVAKCLKDKVFVLAAQRVGVAIDELRPRSLIYFRTGPGDADKLQMMKNHYDERRVLNSAMVLMEYDNAMEIVKKREASAKKTHVTLSEGFMRTLQTEKDRLDKIASNRSKIETVAENENVQLQAMRRAYEQRMVKAHDRQSQLEEMRRQQAEHLAKKSAERQAEILRVQIQKDQREKERIEGIREAGKALNVTLERHARVLAEQKAAKDKERAEREIVRQRKREDVTASNKMRREVLTQQLKEKSKASQKIRAERKAEVEGKRGERWLVSKSRQENAQRVRRQKEFNQKQVMEKISTAYEVMDYMKELRTAVEEKRRANKREMIINVDRWKEKTQLERSITPGPGEYDTATSGPPIAGGSWSRYMPKSDLDWIIYRAGKLPGPGAYNEKDLSGPSGGTWGKYAPKSDVEWRIYRAAQIPGPGDYDPEELPSGAAVKFGNFNPKSDLDIIIARAAQEPGPADYADKIPDVKKPSLKGMQRKLQKAANKLKLAQQFVSLTSSAAKSRRASLDGGKSAVKRSVTGTEVRQTEAMLKATTEADKAKAAKERGDVEAAQGHATKAMVAAKATERAMTGTGVQVGKKVTGGSDAAVATAKSAARRASIHAVEAAAEAQAAAEAAGDEGGASPSSKAGSPTKARSPSKK